MTQYPARYKGQDQRFRGALGYARPLYDEIAAIGIYSIIGNPGVPERLVFAALVLGVTWWVVRQ